MSKEEYDTIIQRMSAISNKAIKPNTTDYNNMRRFEIKEVEVEGSIVSRLVKRGTNEKIISEEDLFDIINELHISSGHGGRDHLKRDIRDKYGNITQEIIMNYLKCCEFCQTKHGRVKKGIVVKPIVSSEEFNRFQVDYIDLQSCPDTIDDKSYKFILHGQDHLTKFCFLRATEDKSAQTTIEHIK